MLSLVRGRRTSRGCIALKSQDIVILLKLISLTDSQADGDTMPDQSVRNLASLTGIGKTEVNNSINRSIDSGLAKHRAQQSGISVNRKALYEFLLYGIKHVFPTKPLELTRGIPTAFAAPVLNNKVFTAGETIPVWPDAQARTMGLAIHPLYRTVPFAVAEDEKLYACLALVDAIRIGNAREKDIAATELRIQIGGP